tara:strand:- start:16988 stop:17332 length:345 start_codon:yes stop_codon:yes gene_type:complete
MAQLSTKIELYAAANGVASVDFTTDVMLQDDSDGKGAYIKEWNLDIAQPTADQLASYETAGNAAETNAGINATRQKQYLEFQHQLEMIYKDQKNGTTTFKDHCDKVRSDNPKTA